MRRALFASVAVLALMSSAPAHAQLGHISRGVDQANDALSDLFEAVQRILASLVTRIPETVVNAPAQYIHRLQSEMEMAAWYTQASWTRYVASYYPSTYINTWRQRAEWQVRKAAGTAEQMAREAMISAGISVQQPFTAAKLDAIALLNKTPLGVLWASQLQVENGLINGQLLSELSSHATMEHQRDTEDRLEAVYRQMQGSQLHAARNNGAVPDTSSAQWSTVVVGESVQHATPPMVEIPVDPTAPGM